MAMGSLPIFFSSMGLLWAPVIKPSIHPNNCTSIKVILTSVAVTKYFTDTQPEPQTAINAEAEEQWPGKTPGRKEPRKRTYNQGVHPPVCGLGEEVDEGLEEPHSQVLKVLWRLYLLGVGEEHVPLHGHQDTKTETDTHIPGKKVKSQQELK